MLTAVSVPRPFPEVVMAEMASGRHDLGLGDDLAARVMVSLHSRSREAGRAATAFAG